MNDTGLLVLVRPGFDEAWLRNRTERDQKLAQNYAGINGESWVNIPHALEPDIREGLYYGSPTGLNEYVRKLSANGFLVHVLRTRMLLEADVAIEVEGNLPSIGYDIAFTQSYSDFYSILLHSIGGSDELALQIKRFINHRALLKSLTDVRIVLANLKSSRNMRSWLEPEYLDDPSEHLVIFEVYDVLDVPLEQ